MPLHEDLLQKFSKLCSLPKHPNVTHIMKLSNTKSLKIVHYGSSDYAVVYNRYTKKVTLQEDCFCGPMPNKQNRDRHHHNEHTRQRLMERFNIEASYEDLAEMVSLCHTKYHHIKLSCSKPQPNGRTKNLIHFKGTDMLAVYEPDSDSIVTAMPVEYLKQEEHDWLYCSKRVRYKQMIKHTKELQNVP